MLVCRGMVAMAKPVVPWTGTANLFVAVGVARKNTRGVVMTMTMIVTVIARGSVAAVTVAVLETGVGEAGRGGRGFRGGSFGFLTMSIMKGKLETAAVGS